MRSPGELLNESSLGLLSCALLAGFVLGFLSLLSYFELRSLRRACSRGRLPRRFVIRSRIWDSIRFVSLKSLTYELEGKLLF